MDLTGVVERAVEQGRKLLEQSKDGEQLVDLDSDSGDVCYDDQFAVAEQCVGNFAAGVVDVLCALEAACGDTTATAVRERWQARSAEAAASRAATCLHFRLRGSVDNEAATQTQQQRWRMPATLDWSLSSTSSQSSAVIAAASRRGVRTHYYRYDRPAFVATPLDADVDASWLLAQLQRPFAIDRRAASCRTPRRNADVQRALDFAGQLSAAAVRLWRLLTDALPSVAHVEASFVPCTALLLRRAGGQPRVGFLDADAVAAEHRRTIERCLAAVRRSAAAAAAAALAADSADQLWQETDYVLLWCAAQLGRLAAALLRAVAGLETRLLRAVTAQLGRQLTAADFHRYVRWRCAARGALPLSLPVRSPGRCGDGAVALDDGDGAPLLAFAQQCGRHSVQFRLDAATLVSAQADWRLHGFVGAQFAGQTSFGAPALTLRARQLSCFVVLLGRLSGARQLDVQYAVVVQNKDAVRVPLDVFLVPSAQQFADAIASMSPDQQAFARAYRAMQMAGTLFAVLVLQTGPLLEALLHLPAASLDKHVDLADDLLRLFAEYQIPADLLAATATATATAAAAAVCPVEQVRRNVARLLDLVGGVGPPRDRLAVLSVADALRQLDLERYNLSLPWIDELPDANADEDDCRPLVVDIGTHKTLAGEAGRHWSVEVKTLVGRPRHCGVMVGMGQKDSYAGESEPGPTVSRPSDDAADTPPPPQQDSQTATASTSTLRDLTAVPSILDQRYLQLGCDGSVRPVILTPGLAWTRRTHTSLVDERGTVSTLNADTLRQEKQLALDLLDCLSKSGGLELGAAELHVVVGAVHCFDKSLMSLLVEQNVDPIAVLDQSLDVMQHVVQLTD